MYCYKDIITAWFVLGGEDVCAYEAGSGEKVNLTVAAERGRRHIEKQLKSQLSLKKFTVKVDLVKEQNFYDGYAFYVKVTDLDIYKTPVPPHLENKDKDKIRYKDIPEYGKVLNVIDNATTYLNNASSEMCLSAVRRKTDAVV